ncbi:MAG: barstar family protein [Lachnospiraceae bacterium]|nr:barstar family protein [Candidatus Merdinaster equi]
MKTYILDFLETNVSDLEDVHRYIAVILEFPEYYGKNLDALYDCLTDMGECEIHLANWRLVTNYCCGACGNRIMDVFRDAAEENGRIRLIFE